MAVYTCHICNSAPDEYRRFGDTGLPNGIICPVCHRPTCEHHLVTVRWRWRETRQVESGVVCRECKRTYRHRNWDPYAREWIS